MWITARSPCLQKIEYIKYCLIELSAILFQAILKISKVKRESGFLLIIFAVEFLLKIY